MLDYYITMVILKYLGNTFYDIGHIMNGNTMLSYPAKLTSKSQVGVPKAVRAEVGLNPGDRVVWVIREGDAVLMSVARYAEVTAGAANGVYGSTPDEVRRYLREERRGWD